MFTYTYIYILCYTQDKKVYMMIDLKTPCGQTKKNRLLFLNMRFSQNCCLVVTTILLRHEMNCILFADELLT